MPNFGKSSLNRLDIKHGWPYDIIRIKVSHHSNRMFCVPKFFYTDCVITNLERFDFHIDEFTARINGRQTKRLAMTNDLYHYLMGSGHTTKTRLWFYDPGFNKALIVAAAKHFADEPKVLHNTSISNLRSFALKPLLVGLLAWFTAWALMVIPVFSWYGANAQKGVHLLETFTIQFGIAAAALLFGYALWVRIKMARLDNWQSGDVTPYTLNENPSPHPILSAKPKAARKAAPELVE